MSLLSVIHLQGLLLMFLSISMLLPIPFSLYYGDSDYVALLSSAAITVIFGFIFFKVGRVDRDLRAAKALPSSPSAGSSVRSSARCHF